MKHSKPLLVLTLIVSVLLLNGGSSRAKAGKPKSIKQAQQSEISKNSGEQTAADDRGIDKMPLSVKLLNTGKSETETAQESKQEQNAASTNWWIVRLGIAGVGVALLQLVAFIVQAYRLKQTVGVMRDTANRQLRAYLGVEWLGALPQKQEPPYRFEIRMSLVNTGPTPAHEITYKAEIAVLPNPLPDNFDFPITSVDVSSTAPLAISNDS